MQIRWSKTRNFAWELGLLDLSHLNYGKNVVPNFYPKMPLTCTFSRNGATLFWLLNLSATFCRKYQNPLTCVKFIASQRWEVIFETQCILNCVICQWTASCNQRTLTAHSISLYCVYRSCWSLVMRWSVQLVKWSSSRKKAVTGSCAPSVRQRSAGSRSRHAGVPRCVVCLLSCYFISL